MSIEVQQSQVSDSAESQTAEVSDLDTSAESESKESAEVPVSAEPETPKVDKHAARFAALARKEKDLRARESQLEARLKALEAQSQKQEEPVKPTIPLEKRILQDPLKTLEELGIGYDKLTQLALNDGKPSIEMQIEMMRRDLESKHEAELKAIRDELLERDRKLAEEKYNSVEQQYKAQLTSHINSSSDYELIRANDAVDVVFDVIKEHYEATGDIISNDQAAKIVEEYLEEEAQKLFERSSKLKSRFQAPAQKPTEAAPATPTLKNSQAAKSAPKPGKLMSRDESIAFAAAQLKWNA